MTLRQQMRSMMGPALSDEADSATCQVCGNPGLIAFYQAQGIPVQTCVLLDSEKEANAFQVGDLLLGFCEICGFIQNTRFDPSLVDYSQPTEESQAFSPRFNEFAEWLAEELIKRFELMGESVLEIGCGKGDFLRLLAERGVRTGIGIDPGFLPNRFDIPEASVVFLKDHFGPAHTDLAGRLVLTRHVMEHIPNVSEFFSWLRQSVKGTSEGALFTEVPDTARVLLEGAFWDIYYEHCSYFTMGSLSRALSHAGFVTTWMDRGFDLQYLLAGAVPSERVESDGRGESPAELAVLVGEFARRAAEGIRTWRDQVQSVLEIGGSTAIWGGGSKAVAFLGAIGQRSATVVDINPHKQGKWLPGVGVAVQAPEVLVDTKPDLVIGMNSVYLSEIDQALVDMELRTRLVAL